MKTRILVWTIVGLLVIAGVIFLVTSSRRSPDVVKDLVSIKEQATQIGGKLDILQRNADDLREGMPPGVDYTAELDSVDSLIVQTRGELDRILETDDVNEAYDKLSGARKMLRDSRRAFRDVEKKVRPRTKR